MVEKQKYAQQRNPTKDKAARNLNLYLSSHQSSNKVENVLFCYEIR